MKINVIMTAMFMTMVGPVGSLRAMNPIAPKKVEVITSTMLNNEVEKALLKSAEAGDKDSVEKALKASADVNVCDQNGMTALHLAARNGHDNIVALLLNKGAEVDIETDKGSTALTLAFYWSHDKVVIQLLEHGAHIEEQTWRSYFSGAINSRIYLSDAIKKHLKKQSDHLKKCLKKELLEKRRKEIEKALFDDRAGNEKENIGSILPSEGGHRAGLGGLIGEYESLPEDEDELLKILNEHQAAKRQTLLEKLEASKRQALLEKFKASSQTSVKKNKIDKANNNLSISVIINDSEGVKDALKEGADVNTQDKDGMAALSWAAFKGHGQIVDLLLKNSTKIAINAQDKNGRTALCWADCRGHRKIVDLLLQYGANKLLLKSNGELGLNDEVRGKNSVSTLCQFCLVARGQSAGGAAGGSCVCGKNKKN